MYNNFVTSIYNLDETNESTSLIVLFVCLYIKLGITIKTSSSKCYFIH